MTEKNAWKMNGFLALFLILLLVLASVFLFIQATAATVIIGVLFVLLAATVASGITIVQPNQARVIIFFGNMLAVYEKAASGPPFFPATRLFRCGSATSTVIP